MKIGVTSKNKIKLNSVKDVYLPLANSFEIIGYEAKSGVGEQPVNEQTLLGARNRIEDVKNKASGLDRIISIENGIFWEDEKWLDKAVVILYEVNQNKENVAYSDSIFFPEKYVKRAQEKGFDKITVAKVMFDAGYVSDSKDPHLYISGIPRRVYLQNTIQKLVEQVEK